MKISDIKQQIKNPGRFSVYIDGSFTFGVDEYTLLENGLKVGTELDGAEIAILQKKADTGKWYMKCVDKSYTRPHSEKEIRDYLYRKDKAEYGDTITTKLKEKNLINDHTFAQWLIESRRRTVQRSNRALQAELRVKGVNSDIITELLENSTEQENEALLRLVENKRRLTRYQDDQKLMQLLARQGYKYEDIKQALQQEHQP